MSWVTWPTWLPCPYMVKILKKSSSPGPIDRWPWNFVCSIVYASTTKVIQINTLGWPLQIQRPGQIWWHRPLYRKNCFFFFFLETVATLGLLKRSTKWSWVSIKSQGHSLTLIKGHSDFKVKTCFSLKKSGNLEPKLIWKLKGEWEWKFIQMSWVIWPTWPCTYMVKTLKNLLLQKQ